MPVTYTETAKQAGPLLERASVVLADVLGESADQIDATWDRTTDANRNPVYTLSLRGEPDWAEASFVPAVFQSPSDLKIRLLQVYGDLLRHRTERLIRNLRDDGRG